MATIPKNVLMSLTTSLNNAIKYAKDATPEYRKELGISLNILDDCYRIPSNLKNTTQFQIDSIQAILDSSFSIKQTTGFNKEVDDTENKVYNTFREMDRYKKTYSNISTNILEKLSGIREIHEIIEKMKNISREIKLFSINSVIVASQAGSQGIAFKSISRFIIELSDSIQKSATQLELYRDKILETYTRMEDLFNKLIQEVYEKQASEVKKNILDSIKKIKMQFTFISIITDDVNKRILQNIQEGQIIERQFKPGVRHVPVLGYWATGMAMLSEIQEKDINEDTPEDILSTLAYTNHIINALIKKMYNHDQVLLGFTGRVRDLYETLVTKFGLAQQDSMYIFNYISIPSAETPSLLDRIFEDFQLSLGTLDNLLYEESTIKTELIEVFSDMQKIHNEGLGFFSSFEKFYVIMNNINVLAQIEMSKKDFDGGNNTGLRAKFLNMLEQLRYFNDDVKNRIQKMLLALNTHINNFTDTQIEQSAFLSETKSFFKTQSDRLDYLKKTSHTTVDAIRDENSSIYSAESYSRGLLDKFDIQGNVFIRINTDVYDSLNVHQGKFNGLLNYYNINLRDYTVNNPFIQNYERIQSKI